jgi:hypothetical protein
MTADLQSRGCAAEQRKERLRSYPPEPEPAVELLWGGFHQANSREASEYVCGVARVSAELAQGRTYELHDTSIQPLTTVRGVTWAGMELTAISSYAQAGSTYQAASRCILSSVGCLCYVPASVDVYSSVVRRFIITARPLPHTCWHECELSGVWQNCGILVSSSI